MSNGQVTAASIAKTSKKDIWYKLGGGPFAMELYQLFLIENVADELRLGHLNKEHLEKIRKYSIDRRLSEAVYMELRKRLFRHKERDSFIVNEIKGIFEFVVGCSKYVKITMDMYKDLNGKQK